MIGIIPQSQKVTEYNFKSNVNVSSTRVILSMKHYDERLVKCVKSMFSDFSVIFNDTGFALTSYENNEIIIPDCLKKKMSRVLFKNR